MIMAAPTPSRNTGIRIAAPIYALLTWLVMADAQRDDEGGIEEVGQDALNPRTPHLEEEAAAVAGRINGRALPIRSLPDEASGTCLNRPHRPGAWPHPSLPDNDTPPQLQSQLVWLSARMRFFSSDHRRRSWCVHVLLLGSFTDTAQGLIVRLRVLYRALFVVCPASRAERGVACILALAARIYADRAARLCVAFCTRCAARGTLHCCSDTCLPHATSDPSFSRGWQERFRCNITGSCIKSQVAPRAMQRRASAPSAG
jgi:hypothetical protein